MPVTPSSHQFYMQRCLQLAALAAGQVAPNPMVGAVLVHNGRIIGEGYHQQYGGAHAEVQCIASVSADDRLLIPDSTIYVSLEPCAHWGKTPPCADLILHHKIKKAVVGCADAFAEVNGKGIEKLRLSGVEVLIGVLEKECRHLNNRFFTFHEKKRPYVILKWAQTSNGFIGDKMERLQISNPFTARITHRWRSEEAAILVGTNTALLDNPVLNTRHWPGPSAVRLVVDNQLRLPPTLHLFDGRNPTVVFNQLRHHLPAGQHVKHSPGVHYYKVDASADLVPQLLAALHHLNLQSVVVEGGAQLLQSFIAAGAWDEARVITSEIVFTGEGIKAPVLSNGALMKTQVVSGDTVRYYSNGEE